MKKIENTALQMIAEASRCPDYGPDMVKSLMKKRYFQFFSFSNPPVICFPALCRGKADLVVFHPFGKVRQRIIYPVNFCMGVIQTMANSKGRVDAPLTVVRPSQNPDLRLSRIRLFIWLIFCQISVYSTLFSSKVVFLLFQSLSIAQVTFLVIALCGSLPSCGITHIHQ